MVLIPMIISLAKVYFDFAISNPENLWSNFQWKLDPYKLSAFTKDDAFISDISVTRISEKKEKPILKSQVLKDSSGFFIREISETVDGGTYYEVRRATEGIQMSFYVNPSWNEISILEDHTNTAGTAPFEFLGKIIPHCLIPFGAITLHGVLMEYQGMGIIISADSGVGKTTHARLWRNAKNALIINGDRSTLRKTEDGWIGYGLPWSGTSGEQINRQVPIKALVILERGEENKAEVLSTFDAFGAFLPHVQCPLWNRDFSEKGIDLLSELTNDIKVIKLTCLPNVDAVEILLNQINNLQL